MNRELLCLSRDEILNVELMRDAAEHASSSPRVLLEYFDNLVAEILAVKDPSDTPVDTIDFEITVMEFVQASLPDAPIPIEPLRPLIGKPGWPELKLSQHLLKRGLVKLAVWAQLKETKAVKIQPRIVTATQISTFLGISNSNLNRDGFPEKVQRRGRAHAWHLDEVMKALKANYPDKPWYDFEENL